ncbi:MAG: O-antigen ligase family protein [Candidatus Omnitrophota bacterium]
MNKERIITFLDRAALLFFALLIFFIPISNAAIESLFGFIFLCLILKVTIRRPALKDFKTFFTGQINLYVLIFYISIGLSLFISGPLLPKSFKTWLCHWGEGVALFYCARVFLKKRHIKVLLITFLVSTVLVGIDGIYQKINGVDFIRGFEVIKRPGFTAIGASLKNYNDFASFLTVSFFINCGFIIFFKKAWQKTPFFLLAILILSNLYLTFSRGAWLSFIVVCLLMFAVLSDRKNKNIFIIFLLVFIFGIFSFPTLTERFLLIVKSGGDADRLRLWKAALLMFKDSPFLGKGLGTFMHYITEYEKGMLPQYTHNCYLQILAETGLAGFACFLLFLGKIILTGYRQLIKERNSVYSGLFAALLVFLIHSFFDTQLFSLKLSILFWILLSFVTVFCQEKDLQGGLHAT